MISLRGRCGSAHAARRCMVTTSVERTLTDGVAGGIAFPRCGDTLPGVVAMLHVKHRGNFMAGGRAMPVGAAVPEGFS